MRINAVSAYTVINNNTPNMQTSFAGKKKYLKSDKLKNTMEILASIATAEVGLSMAQNLKQNPNLNDKQKYVDVDNIVLENLFIEKRKKQIAQKLEQKKIMKPEDNEEFVSLVDKVREPFADLVIDAGCSQVEAQNKIYDVPILYHGQKLNFFKRINAKNAKFVPDILNADWQHVDIEKKNNFLVAISNMNNKYLNYVKPVIDADSEHMDVYWKHEFLLNINEINEPFIDSIIQASKEYMDPSEKLIFSALINNLNKKHINLIISKTNEELPSKTSFVEYINEVNDDFVDGIVDAKEENLSPQDKESFISNITEVNSKFVNPVLAVPLTVLNNKSKFISRIQYLNVHTLEPFLDKIINISSEYLDPNKKADFIYYMNDLNLSKVGSILEANKSKLKPEDKDKFLSWMTEENSPFMEDIIEANIPLEDKLPFFKKIRGGKIKFVKAILDAPEDLIKSQDKLNMFSAINKENEAQIAKIIGVDLNKYLK